MKKTILPSNTLILGNISRTMALYDVFLHTDKNKVLVNSLPKDFFFYRLDCF